MGLRKRVTKRSCATDAPWDVVVWLQVLQDLLDMLRNHQNNSHTARLEWIVIWLIGVEIVIGVFECASILGWVGH